MHWLECKKKCLDRNVCSQRYRGLIREKNSGGASVYEKERERERF